MCIFWPLFFNLVALFSLCSPRFYDPMCMALRRTLKQEYRKCEQMFSEKSSNVIDQNVDVIFPYYTIHFSHTFTIYNIILIAIIINEFSWYRFA